MNRSIVCFVVAAAAVVVCGCETAGQQAGAPTWSTAQPAWSTQRPDGQERGLPGLIYLAAQTLGDRAETLDKTRPIIVSTIVAVNNLESQSAFGKLVSQLVANRLQQRGFKVRDVTFMRALEISRETGEMVLSRDIKKLDGFANTQAVVAGTYAIGGQEIYLNLRLIDAASSTVLSSTDVVIPWNENTSALFASEQPMDKMITFERFLELARKAQLESVP
jgi:TolB-like protein